MSENNIPIKESVECLAELKKEYINNNHTAKGFPYFILEGVVMLEEMEEEKEERIPELSKMPLPSFA